MPLFKAIFWDNDGTLVKTEDIFYFATKQILAGIGIDLTMDYYTGVHLKENKSTFDLARTKGISEETIIQLQKNRDDLYTELLLKGVPVLDGIKETLEKLNGKIYMGVVTSSKKLHFDIIMDKTNLRKYFEFFITTEDVPNEKPDPYPYLLACKKSGFKPEECLAVEDTERGLVAAKKAGITCYAIPTDLSKDNDFSLADKILGSAREIPDLVL